MRHFCKKNLIKFIHNSRFTNTPTSRFITHYLIIPVFCITFLPGQILAKEDIVRRDTDCDGKVNVWQTYRDDKPLERRTDQDGDGQGEADIWEVESEQMSRWKSERVKKVQ